MFTDHWVGIDVSERLTLLLRIMIEPIFLFVTTQNIRMMMMVVVV